VTLAHELFLLFCVNPLLRHSAAPHFEQSAGLADRDVGSHLVSRNNGPVAEILILPVTRSDKEHVRTFQMPV
jgi:hypothetical protein